MLNQGRSSLGEITHVQQNPTSLPFKPIKCTWKGNEAITTSQLLVEVKMKRTKMKEKKGKGAPA